MAERSTTGPQPLTGRVAMWVVVALVLVVAAVVAVTGGDSGRAATARVVLSVGIAGLALVGINALMARLARRSVEELRAALHEVSRTAGGADAEAAGRALRHLDAGDVQASQAAVEEMGARGTSGPASGALATCRRTAKRAARLDRRQQRVGA